MNWIFRHILGKTELKYYGLEEDEGSNIKVLERFDPKHVTQLPEGLNVKGDLNLKLCEKLVSLPETLKVGKSLDLSYCSNLAGFPDGLQRIEGNLILKGCTKVKSLPEVTSFNKEEHQQTILLTLYTVVRYIQEPSKNR